MNHWQCICVECEDTRRDAARYRWLKNHMTFHPSDGQPPVLASVSARIWYHATDSLEYPLDAVIDVERIENSACRTCRGTATISYVDTDGSTKNEQCPDCTTRSAGSTP